MSIREANLDPSPIIRSARGYFPGRFRRRFRGGFSLIEIMVVIVLIALLASIVGISVPRYMDKGRVAKARADLAVLANAVKAYYAEHGRYPDPAGGLDALVPEYLEQTIRDPWGGAYQYELPGEEHAFDVICWGADGRSGGDGADADLTNWTVQDDAP